MMRGSRPHRQWFHCTNRNCDFSCLPSIDVDFSLHAPTPAEEDTVARWAMTHGLRRDRPGQQVFCDHGSDGWVPKTLLVRKNTKKNDPTPHFTVWYCSQRECRLSLAHDGPLVDSWGVSGFRDAMNVLNAWVERKNVDQTIQRTGLTKNTITKKFHMIEALLATHMRYHSLINESYTAERSHRFKHHTAHPAYAHLPVTVVTGPEDGPLVAEAAIDQDEEETIELREVALSPVDHVEVDEVHFGHRKNETGARVAEAGQHIFQTMVSVNQHGQICDFVMRPIADKSAATLQSWIRNQVPPRSVIATDCWKGYIGLNDEYVHTTVNHSDKKNRFVNPINGTTTNCVEFMHRLIKAQISARGGRLGTSINDRIRRIMAHALLAVGSLHIVHGDRRRYMFQCLREVSMGGWPLWEPVPETARTVQIDDDDAETPVRQRPLRTEPMESPTARILTPQPGHVVITMNWPVGMPLPAGATVATQDPAGGSPRTALFARNLAAAETRAQSRGEGRRGPGRPRTTSAVVPQATPGAATPATIPATIPAATPGTAAFVAALTRGRGRGRGSQ